MELITIGDSPRIASISNEILTYSLSEKQDDQLINNFLDSILNFKEYLNNKSALIQKINTDLESITWLEGIENHKQSLNVLVAICKDFHNAMIRRYVGYNVFLKKNIAKDEIYDFKDAIDDFKDIYSSIENKYLYNTRTEIDKITAQLLNIS